MPGHALNVLLTNFDLSSRGGSQLYTRDVALALLQRGHHPFVYSPVLGAVADDLRQASVPVVDLLDRIHGVPDIIHGQNNHELITALLRYPGVPALRLCHSSLEDAPAPFPRVLKYVAVDETTRDRCLFEWGIPADRVEVLLNFVDLERFKPRSTLPDRPTRALVFSNYHSGHVWAVREACRLEGIGFDGLGESVGKPTDRPESILRQYDLIFAKGRAALEAMASGAAVILCDRFGLGPLVTTAEFDRLRPLNFGLRALQEPVTASAIRRQIARYSAEDAAAVSLRVRTSANADAAIDHLVEIYREVIAEFIRAGGSDLAVELRAASTYLRSVAAPPRIRVVEQAGMLFAAARKLYRFSRRVPFVRRLTQSRACRQVRSAILVRRPF